MANKQPKNLLEELKFVGGVWRNINEVRAHTDRIAQVLSSAQIEIEKLLTENKKLKAMLYKLKKEKV